MIPPSRVRAAVLAGLVAMAAGAVEPPLGAQSKSANDGVYTDAQAGRGQKTFEGTCTVCHDVDAFRGNDFVNAWRNQPLLALFETINSTMPADNPGSLNAQEYADIIAYFLQLNRYPAGADELAGSTEVMSAVKMESPK